MGCSTSVKDGEDDDVWDASGGIYEREGWQQDSAFGSVCETIAGIVSVLFLSVK
jgi:hypothetical protein